MSDGVGNERGTERESERDRCSAEKTHGAIVEHVLSATCGAGMKLAASGRMKEYAAGVRSSELSLVEVPTTTGKEEVAPDAAPLPGVERAPAEASEDRFVAKARGEYAKGHVDTSLWVRAVTLAGGDADGKPGPANFNVFVGGAAKRTIIVTVQTAGYAPRTVRQEVRAGETAHLDLALVLGIAVALDQFRLFQALDQRGDRAGLQ